MEQSQSASQSAAQPQQRVVQNSVGSLNFNINMSNEDEEMSRGSRGGLRKDDADGVVSVGGSAAAAGGAELRQKPQLQ
ncbi:hypothetical protein FF1_003627 [Malus domestica]